MVKTSSLKSTIKDQSGAGKTKIGEILSKEGQIAIERAGGYSITSRLVSQGQPEHPVRIRKVDR